MADVISRKGAKAQVISFAFLFLTATFGVRAVDRSERAVASAQQQRRRADRRARSGRCTTNRSLLRLHRHAGRSADHGSEKNLNGDIDVFTAGSLRPLLKITLYAEITTPVTKGIYLRKREDLILRVEARSPNDDEGTYRLFFGGSFEPIVGGPDIAEAETPTPNRNSTPGTRRVSSVGAESKNLSRHRNRSCGSTDTRTNTGADAGSETSRDTSSNTGKIS